MSDYIHTYTDAEQERLFRQGRFLENIVFDFLDVSAFNSIIELGCGNGGVTMLLIEKNQKAKITSIDINQEQVENAKQNIKESRVKFEVGDVYQLTYAENSFDCAFICWVLEHLQEPQKAVNEAYRVLQKGGKILLTEVYNQSLYFYPENCSTILEYFQIFNIYQRNKLKAFPHIGPRIGNILFNAGFKNIQISNKLILWDKRNPIGRNAMMDYYIELILSAKDTLLNEKLIDENMLSKIDEEKEAFKKNEDSIFYYSPFQAIAEK